MSGRPLKFDRQSALETAMHEYWKRGYTNVTVNGICAVLGITRSSFYHSFGSLDDLYGEAAKLYAAGAPSVRIAKEIERMDEYSPTEQIRAFYKLLCKMRARDREKKGCLLVNNIGIIDALSPSARNTTLRLFRKSLEKNKLFVVEAIEVGELPSDIDAETIHDSLQMLTIGLNSVSKLISSEERLWNIADTTLNGLGLHRSE